MFLNSMFNVTFNMRIHLHQAYDSSEINQHFESVFFLNSVKRNQRGEDKLYVGPENRGYAQLTGLYKKKADPEKETPISIDGVQGNVLITNENVPLAKYVFYGSSI